MALPSDEKSTPFPVDAGSDAGSEYLVPKPAAQGYADTNGVVACATAMTPLPKATPFPFPVGRVAGSEYFVPKPDDQG